MTPLTLPQSRTAVSQPARLDPTLAALLMQMRLPIRREFGINLDIYDQAAVTQFTQYGQQSHDATLRQLTTALQALVTGQSPASVTPVASTPPAEAAASAAKPAPSAPAPTTDKDLTGLKKKTVQALIVVCGPMAEIMWASEIRNCSTRDALEQQIATCRQAIQDTLGKEKADAFWKQVLPVH